MIYKKGGMLNISGWTRTLQRYELQADELRWLERENVQGQNQTISGRNKANEKLKGRCKFVDRLKVIENIMGFSHLFIPYYAPGLRTLRFLLGSWQRLFHLHALVPTPDSWLLTSDFSRPTFVLVACIPRPFW